MTLKLVVLDTHTLENIYRNIGWGTYRGKQKCIDAFNNYSHEASSCEFVLGSFS